MYVVLPFHQYCDTSRLIFLLYSLWCGVMHMFANVVTYFSPVSKRDQNYQATRLHFENLVKRYGNPIIILNLIKVIFFFIFLVGKWIHSPIPLIYYMSSSKLPNIKFSCILVVLAQIDAVIGCLLHLYFKDDVEFLLIQCTALCWFVREYLHLEVENDAW